MPSTTPGTPTKAMKKMRTSIGIPRTISTYRVARFRKSVLPEILPRPVNNPNTSAIRKAMAVVVMVTLRPAVMKMNAS